MRQIERPVACQGDARGVPLRIHGDDRVRSLVTGAILPAGVVVAECQHAPGIIRGVRVGGDRTADGADRDTLGEVLEYGVPFGELEIIIVGAVVVRVVVDEACAEPGQSSGAMGEYDAI